MLKSFFSPDTKQEAGIDEAGRGSLIGPVVAAAVILPRDFAHPDLKDSKLLRPAARVALREVILQEAIAWAIGEASETEIDQYNILQATFLAMHRAVAGLSLTPDLLLVDGNRFKPYPFLPHHCMVKGDNQMASIAAAAILAKTHRDALIEGLAERYPVYGWDKNMGYATAKHRAAIAEFGATPWHRKSFQLK